MFPNLHKYLSLSSKPPPPHMCHVVGLPIPPSAFLQLLGKSSSTRSCLGSLPQEAQPVDEAQALCPDEGGGQIFSDLGDNDPQLIVRHCSSSGPGLGSKLGLSNDLHKIVEVLAALSPRSDHQSLQLPEALESPHKWTSLLSLGVVVAGIKVLQSSLIQEG